MTCGKGDDLVNLFTVSFWVLADAEDYFFSCERESILTFLLSFFPVLIVWDESLRKHQPRIDKNKSLVSGVLSLKRIDSGQ